LWNHRWEYDKNPEDFFTLLYRLDQAGLGFQVAVLGECFAQKPAIFLEAREKLKDKIVQFGFVSNFTDYASWLWKADIIPVTSRHDFFGASVVQALYCNCYPLLPKRFSYAEHLPDDMHAQFFYDDFEDLSKRATDLLVNIGAVRQKTTQEFVTKYDWQTMADIYDQTFETLL
jgi:glycosyltransferase involved in cell wall biosynthesis